MLKQLTADKTLAGVYADLFRQYKDKPARHDIWHLRFHWKRLKPTLQADLRAGRYRFSPCRSVRVNNHRVGIWCAMDTLVIKTLTQLLSEQLRPHLSVHCCHLKGMGGAKQAVMQAKQKSSAYPFVLKSDVKSYYASMRHHLMMAQLRGWISDKIILDLLWQFLTHLDAVDAELFECTQGISKGSALAPLLGAVYLYALDQVLGQYAKNIGGFYLRFIDDWLFLCKRRWQLRKAVSLMNTVLAALALTKARAKTYIDRISKGYDWLGYRIQAVKTSAKLTQPFTLLISANTYKNHQTKLNRLYEQGAPEDALAAYVKRWWQWAHAGVELDGRVWGSAG